MGSLIGSNFLDLKAAQTNGIDEYMYKSAPSFQTDTAGAFSFWYRPTTVFAAPGFNVMVGFGNASGAANTAAFFIELRRNSGGTIVNSIGILTRRTNGGAFSATSANGLSLVAGSLYHIVVQSNGTAWDIRVNDTTPTTFNWQTGDGTNPGHWLGDIVLANPRLSFGARTFNSGVDSYADCKINECIYVNRVLTNAEITALYNAGTPRNPHRITTLGSDLKSWWRFGDSRDDATTVYDEIGSNNLTLVNMDASNYVTP